MKKYYHTPSDIDIINAAQSRDVARIKSIRLNNADVVTRCDEKGYTAFHWAAYSDDVEVLDALTEDNYKYFWECLTLKGQTSLHIACANGSIRIARRIIEIIATNTSYATHIDDQNTYKETALHIAAGANNAEIVRILMEAGANTYILDQWSRTARRVSVCLQFSLSIVVIGAFFDIIFCVVYVRTLPKYSVLLAHINFNFHIDLTHPYTTPLPPAPYHSTPSTGGHRARLHRHGLDPARARLRRAGGRAARAPYLVPYQPHSPLRHRADRPGPGLRHARTQVEVVYHAAEGRRWL